jgi:hypothetical protein
MEAEILAEIEADSLTAAKDLIGRKNWFRRHAQIQLIIFTMNN